MSRRQELVLEIIRRHPEGISSTDIVREIFSFYDEMYGPEKLMQRNKVSTCCCRLARFGMVERVGYKAHGEVIWGPCDN